MSFRAIGVAGLVAVLGTLVPAIAVAESGEELRARGEQLAKDGRYSEAIDAFKAAEKVEPRARHACFIALAYTRREAWAQAEIFLEACHQRATASDPLPEWVPMVDELLKERLALAAPIEIRVEPANVEVELAVSSFAVDELIKPRTIHLSPGRHVIIATAKGFNDAQKTIEIIDRSPQVVTITMLPIATKVPDGGRVTGGQATVWRPTPAPSRVPYFVIGGGIGVGLAGGLIHATLFRAARDKLLEANAEMDADKYKKWSDSFDSRRTLTLALYGVGAAAVVTGVVLKLTVFKGKESPAQVTLLPQDGGGMLTVGWTR